MAFTFAAFHLAELAGVVVSSKGSVAAMAFDPACRPLSISKDAFLFLSAQFFLSFFLHLTVYTSASFFCHSGFFLSGQSLIWSLIIRRVWKPDGANSPRLSVRAKLYRLWNEGDGKAAWAVCFCESGFLHDFAFLSFF